MCQWGSRRSRRAALVHSRGLRPARALDARCIRSGARAGCSRARGTPHLPPSRRAGSCRRSLAANHGGQIGVNPCCCSPERQRRWWEAVPAGNHMGRLPLGHGGRRAAARLGLPAVIVSVSRRLPRQGRAAAGGPDWSQELAFGCKEGLMWSSAGRVLAG